MKMAKQAGLAVIVAALMGVPNVGHATTYSLDIGSNGNVLGSPIGTVDITGGGTSLTYQFNLTSGTMSAVYMDVSGNWSAVAVSNTTWTGDIGATTLNSTLGTFTDTVQKKPLGGQSVAALTVTFTGTNLAANYTLLDGNIAMFSAANTSSGLFGDTVGTPLPATWPLFAGGMGMLGLLARRRKRKNAAAMAVA